MEECSSLPEIEITGDLAVTPAIYDYIRNKLEKKLGRLGGIQKIHFILNPSVDGIYHLKGWITRAGKEYGHELKGRDMYDLLTELVNKLHEQLTS